jgi:hypothetical protein
VPSALCGAGRAAPAACEMVSAITTGAETTLAIARAGGRDAGDRSMRKAGRKAWSWDDWNEAARVTNELLVAGSHDPRDHLQTVGTRHLRGAAMNPDVLTDQTLIERDREAVAQVRSATRPGNPKGAAAVGVAVVAAAVLVSAGLLGVLADITTLLR